METTVYVDLFFMINFSMDFLCLFLTSKILSVRLSPLRGILAAVFGGLYASAALFFPFGSLFCFFLDILAGAALCLIAFHRRGELRRAPLYMLVYTAVSMALGGFMTALFNLFNKTGIFDGIKKSDGDGISVWLFALLAILSGLITFLSGRFFSARMARRRVEVELTYGKKSLRLSAMTDSGNLLRDPVGGRPCIIVDSNAVAAILPSELIEASSSDTLMGLDEIGEEHQKRIMLIPAVSVSGSGMLLGVRMDRISVNNKGRLYRVDAVVALSRLRGEAEGCDALLPSCLLMA